MQIGRRGTKIIDKVRYVRNQHSIGERDHILAVRCPVEAHVLQSGITVGCTALHMGPKYGTDACMTSTDFSRSRQHDWSASVRRPHEWCSFCFCHALDASCRLVSVILK